MTDPRPPLDRLLGTLAPAGPGERQSPFAPAYGLLLGAIAAVVLAAVSLFLPANAAAALAAAVLSTAATVALTRGAHELGLAHCIDRLGAAAGPSHAGMLALVLVLAAKLALLAAMAGASPAGVLAALLGGHAVSRFWMLVLPYGATRPVAESGVEPVGRPGLWTGGLWCVPALLVLALAGGLGAALLGALASTIAFSVVVRSYRRRLQDAPVAALAATQQACEVAFYLGAAFGLRG